MFMYSDYSQHLLDHVKKIHFIGCGGSGMYPLIQILAAKGYELSGSDVLDGSIIRYEREMGVKVSLGHNADNVVGADMVVYSAAISKDNVELNAAASYGIPTVERSVLLGYVSRLYKQSICVSGTHGKTTTTSMITTALELAGRDPSAVIGGKLPLINGYGKAGKGDDIVIEACEFAETFLKLTPYLSVVLNIDNDHLDYYGSMGELKFAFKRFALMTQFMIFANADDKNTMDVMYTLDRRVRTFAIDNHGDYRAVNINEYKPGFFEFDLKEWNTTDTTRIRLSVPGRHNIYNALAMCAVCRFVGLSAEQCAEAALNFKGAGRRFEVYGECNGALVIDDYAHHPTELRATLNTAKEMGYKRLIAVHQPFTYSRTKMLFNDFVDVLKIPDITVLTPIMGSREPNDPTITSAKLAAQIPGSVLVNSLEEAAEWVKQNAREGDLVITLGCGDIIKVTPSSKVVGDMTLFMVQNNLTEQDVYDKGDVLDFPQSVVEFFEGRIGIPYQGFPEKLQKIVLKGKQPLTERPGKSLAPADFEAIRKKLTDAGYKHEDALALQRLSREQAAAHRPVPAAREPSDTRLPDGQGARGASGPPLCRPSAGGARSGAGHCPLV